MTVATEPTTEPTMLEEYQHRYSHIQSLRQKRDELNKRVAAIDQQIQSLGVTIGRAESTRNDFVIREAEGEDLQKDWSSLTARLATLRSEQQHQQELKGVIQETLKQIGKELLEADQHLNPYQRGAWAEITEVILREKPAGFDDFIWQVWTSLCEHQSCNGPKMFNLIFPYEIGRKEQMTVRRALAQRFGIPGEE